MSTKNNRDDWSWFSLYDPNTDNNIPAIEGGFEEAYQVEEEYKIADDDIDGDDGEYFDFTEEGVELPVFVGVDEE